MKKITLKIEGMRCPMCETHVNDAIRKALNENLKSVKASASKANAVIVINSDSFDKDKLVLAIEEQGYKVIDCQIEDYAKLNLSSKIKHLFKKD